MLAGRVNTGLILGISLLMVGGTAFMTVRSAGPSAAFAQEGLPPPAAPGAGGGEEAPAADAEEPAAPVAGANTESSTVVDVRKAYHGADVYEKHADATPSQLRAFKTEGFEQGIRYSGLESQVAQTTEKIRDMDITEASALKYTKAEEFLSEDLLNRGDPLDITDRIPEELRAFYGVQGELESLSDAKLEQLMVSLIRAQLQYFNINVIGVIDNGITQMAYLDWEGQKFIVSEGDSFPIFSLPIEGQTRRSVNIGLLVTEIREDFVSFDLTMSMTRENGSTEEMEPVTRTFYIRTVY